MKVVIVAKTRMGNGACVGALNFEGRSLRLIAAGQEWNERFNLEYNIGDVWDVDYAEPASHTPPHVENIVVHAKRRLPPIDDVAAFAAHHMPPVAGGVEQLFEGLCCATSVGTLYITKENGIPPFSTMFWRPDQPLTLDDDGKRLRYRYPTADGGRTLTFVGLQEPLPEIPAGTLLRVSLAHWWRPHDNPEQEERCYVQLSGWYLPEASAFMPPPGDYPAEEPAFYGEPAPFAQPPSPPFTAPRSVQEALKDIFGFDDFRAMQEDIVERVLAKKDVLAIMPTGSGKSLCYQLPALLFPGLTVVVSPLISLMEDQVAQLRELGVPALYLNSTLNYDEYLEATRRVRAGEVRLLYAAPETLLRPETLHLLDQVEVDCLTIDEAHCISEWGHDFRPEYRQLVEVRRRFPDAACLAVTATATQQVRDDIRQTLAIPDAHVFIASFDRDNLFLEVEAKAAGVDQLFAFLSAHAGESGIIYCSTRKQVDTLSQVLNGNGWPALPYHAGLDSQTRLQHQQRFQRDDTPIIVATIAFGMGIDKSNVRFIVHYDLPKNLESYYQQIGRAGRDGLRADCLLLYSYNDASTIQHFIAQQPSDQQRGAQARLEAMLNFASATGCRRVPLLAYFGEAYEEDNCGLCDNCTTKQVELVDLTMPAQKFLSCVKRTGEIFGVTHIVNVLRGSQAQSVLSRNHHKLSTYNIGTEFSAEQWKEIARQLMAHGALERDVQHGSLKLTGKAYAIFKGEPFLGAPPTAPATASSASAGGRRSDIEIDYDRELFELLRQRRKELADAANVPAYIIFSDRSLVEMAAAFPHSAESLVQIHGVGKAKLERYGDEILPIIRDYCRKKGLQEKPRSAPPQRSHTTGLANRTLEVLSLYNAGKSVPEIAETYGVKHRTVLNHLWEATLAGRQLAPGDLLAHSQLAPSDRQRAIDAFAEQGLDHLRPVYDALDGTVSYDELHLLRLYLAANGQNGAERDTTPRSAHA